MSRIKTAFLLAALLLSGCCATKPSPAPWPGVWFDAPVALVRLAPARIDSARLAEPYQERSTARPTPNASWWPPSPVPDSARVCWVRADQPHAVASCGQPIPVKAAVDWATYMDRRWPNLRHFVVPEEDRDGVR